jgi:hypothetical protein
MDGEYTLHPRNDNRTAMAMGTNNRITPTKTRVGNAYTISDLTRIYDL